ncbi:MAG: hypothetical protein ACI4W6_10275 [Acutalibacteraceae bacterium]
MNSSDAEKRYKTYIKSAQGTIGMILVMNLIYILKALISKNLNFWFSLYLTEFMIKSSNFVDGYNGSVPKIVSVIVIVLSIAVLAVLTGLSQKNPKLLYACLVFYALDTVFLLVGNIMNIFGDFCESSFIDIIIHAFVVAFIINGIYGVQKLEKLKSKE